MSPQTHTNHSGNTFFPPPVGGHNGWKEFDSPGYDQQPGPIRIVVDRPAARAGQAQPQVPEQALRVARYLLSAEGTTELGGQKPVDPISAPLWLGWAKLSLWTMASVVLGMGLSSLL